MKDSGGVAACHNISRTFTRVSELAQCACDASRDESRELSSSAGSSVESGELEVLRGAKVLLPRVLLLLGRFN